MSDHFHLEVITEKPTDVVELVDWLLGEAIDASACTLQAEVPIGQEGGEVNWNLIEYADLHQPRVLLTCQKAHFRAMLARIGAHYLNGQLYYGYGECTMNYRSDDYRVIIYMANSSHTGFWVRIYFAAVSTEIDSAIES